MLALASLIVRMVFGLGLIFSGMVDPAKVLGFLDLAGAWDPSLAFVMASAIAVGSSRSWSPGAARCRDALARRTPHRPPPHAGQHAHRVGWGIAGFCPGQGLVALGMGERSALLFVAAMLASMGIFELVERPRRST